MELIDDLLLNKRDHRQAATKGKCSDFEKERRVCP